MVGADMAMLAIKLEHLAKPTLEEDLVLRQAGLDLVLQTMQHPGQVCLEEVPQLASEQPSQHQPALAPILGLLEAFSVLSLLLEVYSEHNQQLKLADSLETLELQEDSVLRQQVDLVRLPPSPRHLCSVQIMLRNLADSVSARPSQLQQPQALEQLPLQRMHSVEEDYLETNNNSSQQPQALALNQLLRVTPLVALVEITSNKPERRHFSGPIISKSLPPDCLETLPQLPVQAVDFSVQPNLLQIPIFLVLLITLRPEGSLEISQLQPGRVDYLAIPLLRPTLVEEGYSGQVLELKIETSHNSRTLVEVSLDLSTIINQSLRCSAPLETSSNLLDYLEIVSQISNRVEACLVVA